MRWTALATLIAGCVGPEPGATAVPEPDRVVFASTVLPILAEHCANPSCHGRPERPLSLFAPRRYRADVARTWLDEPLTPVELEHRAVSALIDPLDPDGSLLLRKALSTSFHLGGAALERDDAPHRLIRAWIAEAAR